MARPTPKAQADNPRAFQISQIQRRYRAQADDHPNGDTLLAFELQPTDPDFPYDIDQLACQLTVPNGYPASSRPTLQIKNTEIPRGFQINIERGFDAIAAEGRTSTLLALMNRLDQRLEAILAGKIAETVKIVPNQRSSTAANAGSAPQPVPDAQTQKSSLEPTAEQLEAAKIKRRSDTRQLEARFSRVPGFKASSGGWRYTIPIEVLSRNTWPPPLRLLRSVDVSVPDKYPLEPLLLHLNNDSPEARAVESAFKSRSREQPGSTIVSQINHLAQNMKSMASLAPTPARESADAEAGPTAPSRTMVPPPLKDDDSHVQHIPRPPEWNLGQDDEDESDEDSDMSSSGTDEAVDTPDEEHEEATTATAPAERGILLSFPRLELHGIELLELTSLNLTVKCERCKDTTDIERLRSATETSKMREQSCKKCAATLAVRFRADMIHVNSVRGGYLDLDGCTVVDMLPRCVLKTRVRGSIVFAHLRYSNFMPTCSECSTAYPSPGVTAVRGDSAFAVCRECHKKMSRLSTDVHCRCVALTLHTSSADHRGQVPPGQRLCK